MSERKKILIIDPESEMMYRLINKLKEHHDVMIAGGSKQTQNYYNAKIFDKLNYFDVIFLEPVMPCGIFSLEKTKNGMDTGWPLYNKFLRELKKTKVVIWSHTPNDFIYPNKIYPDRKWGDNVTIVRKDGSDDDSLLKVVERKNILIIDHEPHYKNRQIIPFEKSHNVELAISIDAVNNRIHQHKKDGGLEWYDLILIDPFFPYDGEKYSKERTHDGTITGYCLYEDLMKELKHPKIIVWTYTPSQYTNLGWKETIVFKSKSTGGDKNELFNIVEELFEI